MIGALFDIVNAASNAILLNARPDDLDHGFEARWAQSLYQLLQNAESASLSA